MTAGGNRISVRDQCLMNAHNQCINFHAEWDENPKNLDDAATPELLAAARSVPPSKGTVEDWPAAWASDTIVVAHQALDEAFTPTAPEKWTVTFEVLPPFKLLKLYASRYDRASGDNVATLVPRQRRSLHAIVAQNLADAEALIVRLEDGVAVADSQRPVIRDLYVQCEKQRELLEVALQLGLE